MVLLAGRGASLGRVGFPQDGLFGGEQRAIAEDLAGRGAGGVLRGREVRVATVRRSVAARSRPAWLNASLARTPRWYVREAAAPP
ncbi:hypothetical protein HEK616_55390 [Streptomyces nigrescens]|uniref:Uncharacterized protein n=1 Tax=Streptomyces nigrescens TaxID=1920 RepID=A0ABM8A0F1_STRNI|nr:hypothetical protein HEK616_55390 [Streptomyces nigrescens]